MSETMKFAFSQIACPQWDFSALARHAAEFGYDGVTLCGWTSPSPFANADIFLTDPQKVRAVFEEQKVAIAALAGDVAISGSVQKDHQASDQVRRLVERASLLGAAAIRIRDVVPATGRTSIVAASMLAEWLAPLADDAAGSGVMILVENAHSLRVARQIWAVLEHLNHPGVAAAWDLLSAALAGERPSVSIPTLNSRLGQLIVRDAKITESAGALAPVGEGDVQIRNALARLRGVGYRGWVSVDWPMAVKADLASAESILPNALKLMKEWIKPPEPPAKPKPAAKPAGAKPAAKPATDKPAVVKPSTEAVE